MQEARCRRRKLAKEREKQTEEIHATIQLDEDTEGVDEQLRAAWRGVNALLDGIKGCNAGTPNNGSKRPTAKATDADRSKSFNVDRLAVSLQKIDSAMQVQFVPWTA